MTVFNGSASLTAQGVAYANALPASVLRNLVPKIGQMDVDFSWTPTLATFSYTVSGNTYPRAGDPTPPTTAKNTAITFTADAVGPVPGIIPVEYYWDMGDGYEGVFGPTIIHTFKIGNQGCTVKLRVTDNYGRKWFASHVVCLA